MVKNDEWTLDDYLDHPIHVEENAKIVYECEPPFVLGIHGDWGTGKTSFLRKLHLYLSYDNCGYPNADKWHKKLWKDCETRGFKNIETIWFDAWRYQFESNPIVALLNEIRAHFSWTKTLTKETEKLIYAALMSIEGITKKIRIQPSKIMEAGEKWENDHLYNPLPSKMCKDLLEEAISTLLGKGEKRLVIFVDDLDRCQGAVAFRFLEAMKIYLSLNNCVFVIGLDVRHVNRAVAHELYKNGMIPERDKDSKEIYAADYLSKMFQQVYYLPTVTDYTGFLDHLMDEEVFNSKEEWIKTIKDANCLPPNPRKIKRFITALSIYWKQLDKQHKKQLNRWKEKMMSDKASKDDKPNGRDHYYTLIFLYLKLMANDIYRILESNDDFWEKLVLYCKGTKGDSEAKEDKHSILEKYEVPLTKDAGGSLDSEFPDPANEKLLRIAPLIRKYKDGQRPTEDQLKLYLLK